MRPKLPAGKLLLDFDRDGNVESRLSLEAAIAEIRIGEDITLHSFLHATERVGMLRCTGSFQWKLQNPSYGIKGVDDPKTIPGEPGYYATSNLVYDPPEVVNTGDTRYFVQNIGEGFSYGIFAGSRQRQGYTEIAWLVATSADGDDWRNDALERVNAALEQGYETLEQSHRTWWRDYWDKSGIQVPDPLFQKNWYLTQYLLASCSRKGSFPMPLQGVWTADNDQLPPWKGDYHGDLNLQMSYFSYPKANHLEEGEAILDYLWDMAQVGRDYARSFYDSEGLCLPSVMTLGGKPIGGYAQYHFSPTNQIWTSQLLERHYRFTGDKGFLSEKVYPYMKEVAVLIENLLEEHDGFLYLPFSSSPEIFGDDQEAFLTPNSNYDLALMRYLFQTLADYAVELENGEETRWLALLKKLPQLAVDEEGELLLCPGQHLHESHRHMSHCMAIYPLRLIPYDTAENRRIIDWTIRRLERIGSGLWVGYSFPWMAELYAVQRNGNGAAARLEQFWRYFCSQNGFHLNGDYTRGGLSTFHYRPFTLEGNFCAADALQEMLLQTENGCLDCFPAIPDAWLEETVSFRDFRGEKGLLVSAVLNGGVLNELILKPKFSGPVTLVRNERTKDLLDACERVCRLGDDRVSISLKAGEVFTLTLGR